MLTRFSVENFLSFRDRTEFSMVAGKSTRLRSHVQAARGGLDLRRLKSAVIYGANASGKSNMVGALAFMKATILHGSKSEARIGVSNFKLDGLNDKPSRFDIEFSIHDRHYIYGFILDENLVREEWLLSLDKMRECKVFSRSSDGAGACRFDHPGVELQDAQQAAVFRALAQLCPDNQLFLAEYSKSRRKMQALVNRESLLALDDLLDWFALKLKIVVPLGEGHCDFSRDAESGFVEGWLSQAIDWFDTGISEIRLAPITPEAAAKKISKEVFSTLDAELAEGQERILRNQLGDERLLVRRSRGMLGYFSIRLGHEGGGDSPVPLEFREQSSGTRRLFDLLPDVVALLFGVDMVLVVDEMERNLHPCLLASLRECFFEVTKGNGAQWIVTTHETNLLDRRLVRQDEVWFVSKKKGVSSMVSLGEFESSGAGDLRTAYLNGQFGAVPQQRKGDAGLWSRPAGKGGLAG